MIGITPRSFQSIKLKNCIVPFGHFNVHQRIGLDDGLSRSRVGPDLLTGQT